MILLIILHRFNIHEACKSIAIRIAARIQAQRAARRRDHFKRWDDFRKTKAAALTIADR